MDTTIVVTVADVTNRKHVMTSFCSSVEEARMLLGEVSMTYPGTGFRVIASPSLEELEAAEKRRLDAVLREAWVQSMLFSPAQRP